jgi:hypothetical protein
MPRLYVICLPDNIIALPATEGFTDKESLLVPTRSINKNATKMPAWIFITSEELETDSDDYNRLKETLAGFSEIEDGRLPHDGVEGYVERIQTVITSLFRNLEADPNFKDR